MGLTGFQLCALRFWSGAPGEDGPGNRRHMPAVQVNDVVAAHAVRLPGGSRERSAPAAAAGTPTPSGMIFPPGPGPWRCPSCRRLPRHAPGGKPGGWPRVVVCPAGTRAAAPGRSRRRRCRHLAGQWFRPGVVPESRREEDLTMSDRAPAPGSSGNDLSGKSDRLDDASEAALMREIIRKQERHREGGVEPELDDVDGDTASDA